MSHNSKDFDPKLFEELYNKTTYYFVFGAEYLNTDFRDMHEDTMEKYGPFKTYEDAKKKWHERAWRTVDNCNYRFIIYSVDSLTLKKKSHK